MMSSDALYVRPRSDAKNVLIVFSSRGTPRGKFTFSRVTENFPVSRIHVNDYSNTWYLNGAGDFRSDGELAAALKDAAEQNLRPGGEIWTLGASMGGYAALRYGSVLNANKILAFTPESEIGLPLGRSIESVKPLPEDKGDLTKLDFRSGSTVGIVLGNNDLVDYYSASRLKNRYSNVKVKVLNNVAHGVPAEISGKTDIGRIIYAFFSSGNIPTIPGLDTAKLHSVGIARDLRIFNEMAHLKREIDQSKAGSLEAAVVANPDWGMAHYLYGLLLEDMQLKAAALNHYQTAFTLAPILGRPKIKAAELLYSMRRDREVVSLMSEFLQTRTHPRASMLLSMAYERLGQIGNAIAAVEQALFSPLQDTARKRLLDLARRLVETHS